MAIILSSDAPVSSAPMKRSTYSHSGRYHVKKGSVPGKDDGYMSSYSAVPDLMVSPQSPLTGAH